MSLTIPGAAVTALHDAAVAAFTPIFTEAAGDAFTTVANGAASRVAASATTKPRKARAAKAASKRASAPRLGKAATGAKRPHRSKEELANIDAAIVTFVTSHAGTEGVKMSAIETHTGTESAKLRARVNGLRASGTLKSVGEKSATRYFPAS